MFLLQLPQVRETEVFTRLPQRFRRTGVRSSWADANRGGQATDSFLEGPVFDAAGNLYVTDIPFGRVFKIDATGEWEQVAEWDGEPNGAKFLNERELLVTDYRNGLMAVDVTSGAVRPYLDRRNSERFKASTTSSSTARGTCTSPTRARPGCTTRPGACTACGPTAGWTCCWPTCPAPTAWRCRPTSACCTWPSPAPTRSGACR
jgi:gluconolactonase